MFNTLLAENYHFVVWATINKIWKFGFFCTRHRWWCSGWISQVRLLVLTRIVSAKLTKTICFSSFKKIKKKLSVEWPACKISKSTSVRSLLTEVFLVRWPICRLHRKQLVKPTVVHTMLVTDDVSSIGIGWLVYRSCTFSRYWCVWTDFPDRQ